MKVLGRFHNIMQLPVNPESDTDGILVRFYVYVTCPVLYSLCNHCIDELHDWRVFNHRLCCSNNLFLFRKINIGGLNSLIHLSSAIILVERSEKSRFCYNYCIHRHPCCPFYLIYRKDIERVRHCDSKSSVINLKRQRPVFPRKRLWHQI